MSKRTLTILCCIAIAVVLVGCDTNRAIQSNDEPQAEESDSEQTGVVENLELKEFEPK